MLDWGLYQILGVSVIAISLTFAPLVRLVSIAAGAKGFVTWREWFADWAFAKLGMLALTAAVFMGGFWN